MDTWRTWELVLPTLERHRDVLAPTLPGHAGGPPISAGVASETLVDAVEAAIDAAGFDQADVVGNSLGGFVALQLAERGRARSVVAFAPAGGWDDEDALQAQTNAHFRRTLHQATASAPYVDQIVAHRQGRRLATEYVTVEYEHIPPELIAHQIAGVAGAHGASALLDFREQQGWGGVPEPPPCPVRFVWGTEDRLLPWPETAARFRTEAWGDADWVVLDGVGHCPQLDVPAVAAELILEFTGRP